MLLPELGALTRRVPRCRQALLKARNSLGPLRAPMVTLHIMGGRKEKIRPGDVLGALTKDLGFAGTQIGKINVNEFSPYVAVDRQIARAALQR